MVLPLAGTSTRASANGLDTSLSNSCATTLRQISAGRSSPGKFAPITPRHCSKLTGLDGGVSFAMRPLVSVSADSFFNAFGITGSILLGSFEHRIFSRLRVAAHSSARLRIRFKAFDDVESVAHASAELQKWQEFATFPPFQCFNR